MTDVTGFMAAAMAFTALFIVGCFQAAAMCAISEDVRRFVDACDRNEREARGE